MESNIKKAIKELTDKAKNSENGINAQQYSQAAVNLCNALHVIKHLPKQNAR